MSDVVWKKFKLGELFYVSTEHYLNKSKKYYDISEFKSEDYPVAVCSATKQNNGIVGYIAEVDDVPEKKRKGYLTKGGFGHFFYQDDWFIKPGGSWGMLDILKFKDEKVKHEFDKNILTYKWLAKILTKIFEPMSSFGYSIPFDREIILLPCIEVNDNEFLWEENGHFYNIASDYISELMDKAKNLRELKTIKVYEAQREKYDAERAKYKKDYLIEKQNVVWKKFFINDLFEPTNVMMISKVKKLLDVVSEKDNDHSIAIVGASGFNNGITGWLLNSQSEGKEISNVITISYDAAYSGTAFYQKEKFVTTQNFGTHGALLIKSKKLENILNEECYQFLCKILIKIFQKNFCYGWNFKIHGDNLLREVMLLPCLEVSDKAESIWEENGKYYKLARNYISYLYLSGMVNYNQRLIDNYTYQY